MAPAAGMAARARLGRAHAAGPDFEAAGPDFEAARPDFEAAGPDFEAAGPDFEAAGLDFEAVGGMVGNERNNPDMALGEPLTLSSDELNNKIYKQNK